MEKEEKKRTSIKGEESKSIQPKCVDMEETEICIIKEKYPPSPNQDTFGIVVSLVSFVDTNIFSNNPLWSAEAQGCSTESFWSYL